VKALRHAKYCFMGELSGLACELFQLSARGSSRESERLVRRVRK
jgi:hypothetical protein